MTRIDGWEINLFELIDETRDRPFEWGSWDCVSFTNAAIKAMTGEDAIPKELSWTDESSAKATIKAYGKTISGCITKALKLAGLGIIKPAFMSTGDVVLYKKDSLIVGICNGGNILSPSDDGLEVLGNDLAQRAWRIHG